MINNLGLTSPAAFSNNPGDIPPGSTAPKGPSRVDKGLSTTNTELEQMLNKYNGNKNAASLSFSGTEGTIQKAVSFLNRAQAFIRKEVSVIYNYLITNSDKIEQTVKKILDMLPKSKQGGNI